MQKLSNIFIVLSVVIWTSCFFNAYAAPVAGSPENPPFGSNPTSCPAGEIFVDGICCLSSTPYNVSGACSQCPIGLAFVDGVCKSDQCSTGQVLENGVCKDKCYQVSFLSHKNNNSGNFSYNTTTGSGNACLDKLIHDSIDAQRKGGYSSKYTKDSLGNISFNGSKWADDALVGSLWRSLVIPRQILDQCMALYYSKEMAAFRACLSDYLTPNYEANKSYVACKGKFDNVSVHGNSVGFGEGWGRGQPSCGNGSFVINEDDCSLVKTADIANQCSANFHGISKITYYQSTPVSVILDRSSDINDNFSIVRFPLDPSLDKNYWIWKGSAKNPLLVFDPEHKGIVTSASQLFGNWSFGGQGLASLIQNVSSVPWNNGFDALATLDKDGNGKISGEELSNLALWYDDNQDGISQPGEVRSIEDAGIKSLAYTVDKVDALNKTVEVTKGYVRELAGKVITGKLIDWTSDGAGSKYHLLVSKLYSKTSLPQEVQAISQTQDAVKGDHSDSSKFDASLLSGAWAWTMDESAKTDVRNGYLLIGSDGSDKIQGRSISQLPFAIKNNGKEQEHTLINFVTFIGNLKNNVDGTVRLDFKTSSEQFTISSTAKILTDKTMKGESVAKYKDDGKVKTIRYTWAATKLE